MLAAVETSDEVQRLRALVGPSEASYEALRRDRDEAVRVARDAMAEAGRLHSNITGLHIQVSRARQDQEHMQIAAAMKPAQRAVYLTRHRWATSVTPRLARVASRLRRRIAR